MKYDLQKYFEISTIHGLSYFSKKSTLIERIFWITSLGFSIVCTFIFIIKLIIRIRDFPIVVYLSDQSVSVSEINFPAVTICPQFMVQLDSGPISQDLWILEKFSRYEKHTLKRYFYEDLEFGNEVQDEARLMNFNASKIRFVNSLELTIISYLDIMDKVLKGHIKLETLGMKILKRLQIIDFITKRDFFRKLNFSVPTNDFLDVMNEFDKESEKIFQFNWNNDIRTYFSEIITPYGLCFTFSIAHSHDLLHLNKTSNDFHYQAILLEDPNFREELPQVPEDLVRKVSSSKVGLLATIHSDVIFENVMYNEFYGYNFMFHEAYELPSLNSKLIKLNCDESLNILVDLQINTIDDSIRDLDIKDRDCFLEDEKILNFFKVYTKSNCESECMTNFILNKCGCVEFFMIRNSTTRICSASEASCYQEAEREFVNFRKVCECLDPCDNVKYQYEVSPYRIHREKVDEVSFKLEAAIKFKNNFFNKFVRKKQFDTIDFLSFVGGILGLFAGFSALSFVELIYWFTVRRIVSNFSKLKSSVNPENELEMDTGAYTKFKRLILSYFNESSIHGLVYVVEFSIIDSIFWIFFIISSMTLCFHLILTAHEKVPNSRVIGFDDNFLFNDEVPFPAFTIVPPFYEPYDIIRFKGSIASQDDKSVEKIAPIVQWRFCEEQFDAYGYLFIPFIFKVLANNSKTDWFRNQTSSFNGRYQPEFAEIRTLRGMGFTFNMIDFDEMINSANVSHRFQYNKDITTRSQNLQLFPKNLTSPLKFYKTGKALFSLNLVDQPTINPTCLPISLMVHNSDYLPTFSARNDFFQFEYKMSINIEVTPEIVITDDDLRILSPEMRECYFEGEKSLKYFKKYTERNCEIECFRNHTMDVCGCVEFEHPFESDDELCKIVNKQSMSYCPTRIKSELFGSDSFSVEKNCSCLPMCNSVSYSVKYVADHETEGAETTINVWMNMEDIMVYRRYQQFTTSDVVSYVGGLLGLFAGISMLSIVEFCYFFTIRMAVNLWRILIGRS